MDSPLGIRPRAEIAALKHELVSMEWRIRTDLREKHMQWLELSSKAMQVLAAMIAAVAPSRPSRAEHRMTESDELPVPHLEGRPINVEEFRACTPEKFELIAGYLFDTVDHPESRRRLLALLLTNVGLREAVRLAPEDQWREALATPSAE